MTKRPEKKSETIEVRVSYSEKLAFMEACKKAGTTASHAIRDYMRDVLSPADAHTKRKRGLALFIGLTSLTAIMAGAYLTFTARPQPDASAKVLSYFDQTGDGAISAEDTVGLDTADQKSVQWIIEIMDSNRDARVDVQEIRALANITIELRSDPHKTSDHEAGRKIVLIPDGISEAERQAYLDQIEKSATHLSPADHERLRRIVDALTEKRINN